MGWKKWVVERVTFIYPPPKTELWKFQAAQYFCYKYLDHCNPTPVSKLICVHVKQYGWTRLSWGKINAHFLYISLLKAVVFFRPVSSFCISPEEPVVMQEALLSNDSQNIPDQTFFSCKTLVDFISKCGVIAL